MEHGMVLVWLVVTILLILLMIMKFKLNAAVAMFVASMFMGVVNGTGWLATVQAITAGFGSTMTSIGLSIGFGVILGQLVADTGAVQVIADTMLKVFGEKRADTALGVTGFIAVSYTHLTSPISGLYWCCKGFSWAVSFGLTEKLRA